MNPDKLSMGKQGTARVEFERQFIARAQALMGHTQRSPITGEISLENAQKVADFFVVDLMKRPALPSSIQALAQDPYIFRPVPLAYRTWFYHTFWKRREMVSLQVHGAIKHEHEMLVHALNLKCVDAQVSAGRHSSMVIYAVAAFLSPLTSDNYLIITSLLITILLYVVSVATNHPSKYRYSRVVTLPVRLANFIWIVLRFQATSVLATVGWVSALAGPLIDALTGDAAFVTNYKYSCHHDILRILPNRVFICERKGGRFQDIAFGSRGQVDERVTGFKNWCSVHTLMADISGLICELRPMSPEDWLQIMEEWAASGSHALPYLGLDVFADNDGVIKPVSKVVDMANNTCDDSVWASPKKVQRPSQELVLEDMDNI